MEGLASAEKASRKVAQLRAAEEERLRQECTFRPNTAKPRVKGYGDEFEAPQPKAKLAIAGQASGAHLAHVGVLYVFWGEGERRWHGLQWSTILASTISEVSGSRRLRLQRS